MKKLFKKIFFTVCLLMLSIQFLNAQVNLVKNPSFEELLGCPNGWFQADSAKYWSWIEPFCDTSFSSQGECRGEFYTSCCTNTLYCGIPYNSVGYQWPRTGNSYIELLLISGMPSVLRNSRDYLKGQLSSTLQAGKNYCLTFYYNVSNRVEYAVNRLGAYIDNGIVSSYNCCKDMPVTPQAQNNPAVFMTDTMNWVKIQNSFTAIGNENTITLGNFVDSSTIQFQLINNGGNLDPYYNIDDISLIPIDLAPFAGRDTSIASGDSVYIGRPSEVGLDDDCIWYVSGNTTPLDTVAGLWVKPTATTSYVVEQNICGTITYDTVEVAVSPLGVKQITGNNNQLSVYPNPTSQTLNITFIKTTESSNTIKLIDVTGQTVYNNVMKGANEVIDISELAKGVYMLIVSDGISTSYKKVIVE